MFDKKDLNMRKWILPAFAIGTLFMAACSESGKETAGTSEEAEGITAVTDWEVAGVSQKGPFVTGSAVTVQELDGITLKQTGKSFKGSIKSDKGDFVIKDINLKSQYAILEASGYYRDEISGKKSSAPVTLRALTDLSNRKTVNINLLTHLEYERVSYLLADKKMPIADAKAQAESEVLASFAIEGDFAESEDLNIFESGDGNAALLAVSVLLQSDVDVAGLTERMGEFSIAIAEGGSWDDADTKTAIADWACDADLKGSLKTVRKNVEDWKYADTVPAFEKYVTNFWWNNYGLGVCNDKRENETKRNVNKLSKLYNEYFVCEGGRWYIPGDEPESSSSVNDNSSSSGKDPESSSSDAKSSSSYVNPFSSSFQPITYDSIPRLPEEVSFLEQFFDEYTGYIEFEGSTQKDWFVTKQSAGAYYADTRDSLLAILADTLASRGFAYKGKVACDSVSTLDVAYDDSAYTYEKKSNGQVYRVSITKWWESNMYVGTLWYDLKIVILEDGAEEISSVDRSSLRFETELPEEVGFLDGYGSNVQHGAWNDDSLTSVWTIGHDISSMSKDVATCDSLGRPALEALADSIGQLFADNGFALVEKDTVPVYHDYRGISAAKATDGMFRRTIYEKETEKAKYSVITYGYVSPRGDVFNTWYIYVLEFEVHIYYKSKPE